MRVGILIPCCLLLVAICAADQQAFRNEDALPSRNLLQFQDQVLPEDFVIPELTCEKGGMYPYVVSVRDRNGDHLCGGVVISPDHVLTAAHCVDPRFSRNSNPRPLLHIGGWDRDNPIEKKQTKSVEFHPGWKGNPKKGGDLVILTLDEPTCVRPIYKIATTLKKRTQVEFLGFGRTSIGGTFSFLLQGGNYTFIPKDECEDGGFTLDVELQPGMDCGKSPQTAGVCVGDDGGPLIIRPTFLEFRDILVGIASFATTDCTDEKGVSIFTDMKATRKWILEFSDAEAEKRADDKKKRAAKKKKKAGKKKGAKKTVKKKTVKKKTVKKTTVKKDKQESGE